MRGEGVLIGRQPNIISEHQKHKNSHTDMADSLEIGTYRVQLLHGFRMISVCPYEFSMKQHTCIWTIQYDFFFILNIIA